MPFFLASAIKISCCFSILDVIVLICCLVFDSSFFTSRICKVVGSSRISFSSVSSSSSQERTSCELWKTNKCTGWTQMTVNQSKMNQSSNQSVSQSVTQSQSASQPTFCAVHYKPNIPEELHFSFGVVYCDMRLIKSVRNKPWELLFYIRYKINPHFFVGQKGRSLNSINVIYSKTDLETKQEMEKEKL